MEVLTYTVQLEPLPQGGFAASVPALPGCVTWGRTFEEAVRMAREAVELWVEELQELGLPIPEEQDAPQPVKLGIQIQRPAHV